MKFTTWSSTNRVTSEALATRFTRELVLTTEGYDHYGASYLLYKRIRTKKYSYLGMTKATAMSCARAMNLLWLRRVPDHWVFFNDDSYGHCWRALNPVYYPLAWKLKPVADVTVSLEADDIYRVDITVNEELEFRRKACTSINSPATATAIYSDHSLDYNFWTQFEENPDLATPLFRNGNAFGSTITDDFDYDEA